MVTAERVYIVTPRRRFALPLKILGLRALPIKSRPAVVLDCVQIIISLLSRCTSGNCLDNLTCGVATDAPRHLATWVFAVVGIAIVGGMVYVFQCVLQILTCVVDSYGLDPGHVVHVPPKAP